MKKPPELDISAKDLRLKMLTKLTQDALQGRLAIKKKNSDKTEESRRSEKNLQK